MGATFDKVIGAIMMIVGSIMWIGNVFGMYETFEPKDIAWHIGSLWIVAGILVAQKNRIK